LIDYAAQIKKLPCQRPKANPMWANSFPMGPLGKWLGGSDALSDQSFRGKSADRRDSVEQVIDVLYPGVSATYREIPGTAFFAILEIDPGTPEGLACPRALANSRRCQNLL
jgi:hypothetical protein